MTLTVQHVNSIASISIVYCIGMQSLSALDTC